MSVDDWIEKQRIARELDREEKRILAMSPEEIDREIRAQGKDPADVVEHVGRIIDAAVAKFYRATGKLN